MEQRRVCLLALIVFLFPFLIVAIIRCITGETSENFTECICSHLTSFAISHNPSFAPHKATSFPALIVGVVLGALLLVALSAISVTLYVCKSRETKKRRKATEKELEEAARTNIADIAVKRSEISASSKSMIRITFLCLFVFLSSNALHAAPGDEELRQAVHEQMMRAGLVQPNTRTSTSPPLPPPPTTLVGSIDHVQNKASTSSSSATTSGNKDLVPRGSSSDTIERSARGGLRFWNKEMAVQSSDQVSARSQT